jgi:hypothetical protein
MSLRSFISGLKTKNILIGIVLIGLVVSVTFNIINAPKREPPTTAVISAGLEPNFTEDFTKGFIDFSIYGLAPAIILIFIIVNFELFFNNQLNAPIPSSDICSVVPGTFTAVSRIPSFYFAHLTFFLSYIFMNAYSIYSMELDANVDSTLIKNRKYRSFASMIIVVLLLLAILGLRYFTSNCESPLGILVTLSIFSFVGFAWYKFAEYCGARNSDIMGISLSIVSENAKKPVLCARTS